MKNRFFEIIIFSFTFLIIFLFILMFISLFFNIDNLSNIKNLNVKEIFYAIKLSLFTATISTILAMFLALPIAYLLSLKDFKGKYFIETILDLPIVLSPIAIGTLIILFFNTLYGRWIEGNIAKFIYEIKGIIVAQTIIIISYAVKFLKNTFDNIDREILNIARTLGADKIKLFFKVILPLSYRGIASTTLFIWARAIGEFGATVTVAGATLMKTETLPIAIFLNFENGNITNMIFLIIILIFISLSILFFIRTFINIKFFVSR